MQRLTRGRQERRDLGTRQADRRQSEAACSRCSKLSSTTSMRLTADGVPNRWRARFRPHGCGAPRARAMAEERASRFGQRCEVDEPHVGIRSVALQRLRNGDCQARLTDATRPDQREQPARRLTSTWSCAVANSSARPTSRVGCGGKLPSRSSIGPRTVHRASRSFMSCRFLAWSATRASAAVGWLADAAAVQQDRRGSVDRQRVVNRLHAISHPFGREQRVAVDAKCSQQQVG